MVKAKKPTGDDVLDLSNVDLRILILSFLCLTEPIQLDWQMLADKGNYTLASARTTWNNARRRLIATQPSGSGNPPKVAVKRKVKVPVRKAPASLKRQRSPEADDDPFRLTHTELTKKLKITVKKEDEVVNKEMTPFAKFCALSSKQQISTSASDSDEYIPNDTEESSVSEKAYKPRKAKKTPEPRVKVEDADEVAETEEEVMDTAEVEEKVDVADEAVKDADAEDNI